MKKVERSLDKSRIAIIGGSGVYHLKALTHVKLRKIKTRYGRPSDNIQEGIIRRKNGTFLQVDFLPRHGAEHQLPPHAIPYRANIAALSLIGAPAIFATTIVGSLQKKIHPGDIVIPDQFIDMTNGRDDYFAVEGTFKHMPMAEPYCPRLRAVLIGAAKKIFKRVHTTGTVVVIQGPRFSTFAEGSWFKRQGFDVINMTQYPEVYFARESGMCYASCAAVTDYNPGVATNAPTLNQHTYRRTVKLFQKLVDNIHLVLGEACEDYRFSTCTCQKQHLDAYYKVAE